MCERRLLFVVNPASGRAMIKNKLLDAVRTLSAAGYLVTVCPTTRVNEAAELVARLGDDYERIVVSGGDGTINEAVNGLMRLERKIPLAIIPSGTTNDYAYTLGVPSSLNEAAEIAARGSPFDVDLGLFNGRYFTYVAAFGLFTEIPYETPQDLKNVLGGAAYALEGAKRIMDIKSYRIKLEHDGGVIEDDVIIGIVSNTVSIAGLRTVMPDARLDDGLLEITLVRRPTSISDIQAIINILLDLENIRAVENDFLTHLSTTRAAVSCEEGIAWTIDGESGGVHLVAEISNAPLAARLVIGESPLVAAPRAERELEQLI